MSQLMFIIKKKKYKKTKPDALQSLLTLLPIIRVIINAVDSFPRSNSSMIFSKSGQDSFSENFLKIPQ